MSNHLTPTELAFETGLERQDVITTCMQLGVPIFEGKIDKSLFAAARRSTDQEAMAAAGAGGGAGGGSGSGAGSGAGAGAGTGTASQR